MATEADGLMDEVKDLLLDIWREACRHIEIGESAGNLAKLIAKHLPIASLQIRRVHAERHTLETVGLAQSSQLGMDRGGIDHNLGSDSVA